MSALSEGLPHSSAGAAPAPETELLTHGTTSEVWAELLAPGVSEPRAATDDRGPAIVPVSASDDSADHAPHGALTRFVSAAKLLVAAVVTYTFLFNFSVVRGNSMAPRIHDGDRILIDHLSYWFGEVGQGDIVVLKYPLDPSVDYIKRVIGLPGDDIWLHDGEVWVNGQRIEEPYVENIDRTAELRTQVKPAHYFVLGDNRVRSSDSRDFGFVPQDYVRGRVEVRIWPPARFGRIDG